MVIYIVVTQTEEGCEYRSVGFYSSVEKAKEAIEENRCDIFESFYEYAVVEAVEEGLHPKTTEEAWYKWDHGKGRYVACETPDWSFGSAVCLG